MQSEVNMERMEDRRSVSQSRAALRVLGRGSGIRTRFPDILIKNIPCLSTSHPSRPGRGLQGHTSSMSGHLTRARSTSVA